MGCLLCSGTDTHAQSKMQKTILTPEECGLLIPHRNFLINRKIARLDGMKTRTSKFIPGERQTVMSSRGVLVTPTDSGGLFILNGNHRAYWAALHGFKSEAYVVKGLNDIIYHTPHLAYGLGGQQEMIGLFTDARFFINHYREKGAGTISDLVNFYHEKGRHPSIDLAPGKGIPGDISLNDL